MWPLTVWRLRWSWPNKLARNETRVAGAGASSGGDGGSIFTRSDV